MSAIERCRTAALGGHVARCEDCAHTHIAYNSCRNRHCPKCQGAAAREWLAERDAELLPVPYFHVVYTLPAAIRDIAYQNNSARRKTLTAEPTPRRAECAMITHSILQTTLVRSFARTGWWTVCPGPAPLCKPKRST